MAGIYAIVCGLSTLVGWFANIPQLTDWDLTGISMMPNTAVAAAAAGAALLLLSVGSPRLVRLLGGFVALIGGATLFEYATGIDLGIDRLLVYREWGQRGTVVPGRMGLPGSSSLTLIGTAILLASFERTRRYAVVGGLLAMGIASLSLIGYLLGADRLYTIPHLTTIAMQTSTMVMALGIGLIAAVPEAQPARTLRDHSAAAILARRALPALVVLPVLLGWLSVLGQEAGLFDPAFGTSALVMVLIALLLVLLWRAAAAVRSYEKPLRESEEQLRDFFDQAAVGLHWVGPDGTILLVNQTELELLGYARDEYVGRNIAELHADPPVIEDILRRLSAGETLTEYPARLRAKDGSIKEVLISSNVFWDEGRFVHTRCFTRDITDQKRAEEALREADRRKDQFLATLAHELRNPLAPVRNSLEIIKRADGNSALIAQAHATMDRQVSQMERLIDDLLDVSRITMNRLELRKQPVELASVIHHSLEACRRMAEARRHEIIVTLPPKPIYLDGDPVRLAQIFGNLLDNACKYTEPGGRVLVTGERDAGEVVVTVRDSGIGIPAGMLPGVFEMFSQVDRTLERTHGGLGIGLNLVKQLVEMHGGTVEARSEGEGLGSEFVVRLPILAGEPPVIELPSKPAAGTDTPRRRVLVVDDNLDSAESLAALLRMSGHETRLAFDGLGGIAEAERFRPDVVLLDIGMPKLNGFDACRRIREQPWGRSMLILALTGWGQDADRRNSDDAGFDGHFVKPVDPAALLELMASARAGEAPAAANLPGNDTS